MPCLLHRLLALPHKLLVFLLQGLLSKADQNQWKACYQLQWSLNEVWIHPSAGNLTADTTLQKNEVSTHWLRLNLAAAERKALFAIEQYEIDFHLLASKYRNHSPFAGGTDPVPWKEHSFLAITHSPNWWTDMANICSAMLSWEGRGALLLLGRRFPNLSITTVIHWDTTNSR